MAMFCELVILLPVYWPQVIFATSSVTCARAAGMACSANSNPAAEAADANPIFFRVFPPIRASIAFLTGLQGTPSSPGNVYLSSIAASTALRPSQSDWSSFGPCFILLHGRRLSEVAVIGDPSRSYLVLFLQVFVVVLLF